MTYDNAVRAAGGGRGADQLTTVSTHRETLVEMGSESALSALDGFVAREGPESLVRRGNNAMLEESGLRTFAVNGGRV